MLGLAKLSLRFPVAVLVALALATCGLASGIPRLESDVGYRAFLGREHPAIVALDGFVERFGGGIPLAAVWTCGESSACDTIFDPASLAMAHAVARTLEATRGVQRVDSPATTPLLAPELFGLPRGRQLAANGEPARDVEALALRALRDPVWVGQIVAPDGKTGAIVAHLESSEGEISAHVVAALEATLAPFEASGFRFYLVGGPLELVIAGAELEAATVRIVPVMVCLIVLVLLALFRSWVATALALAAPGLAVLWTFGAMSWLGWAQNSLTQAVPPLVLAIGLCNAVHVLAAYASHSAVEASTSSEERRAIALEVCGDVGSPCLLTTLTTAAGFASFGISTLESFARFGLIAALGVLAALFLTFTLLPVVLVRLPASTLHRVALTRTWREGLTRLGKLGEQRAGVVIGVSAVAVIIGAVGVRRLQVDASFEELYGEESRVVASAQVVADRLRKPDTLEVAVFPAEDLELSSPAVLSAIAELQSGLSSLDGLGRSLSILDPARELHSLLHGEELVLADTEASAMRTSSLFRLLQVTDPGGFALFVDSTGRALRITVEADKPPQERLRALLAEAHELQARILPAGWKATLTGPLWVVRVLLDDIRSTQLASFAVAGAIVAGLLTLFFGSVSFAALAIIPTVLPILLTLGAMGLAGIALDIGGAMVATVVLGIAVDDAIHLLVHYRRRWRRGEAPAQAVAAAIRSVGRALVTTSLALTVGFFALLLSPWQSIANFGLISGIAILAALVSDLVVLPAVLVTAGRLGWRASRMPRA